MVCCGCAPLAVSTVYQKIDELAERGLVCPYASASAKGKLLEQARDTAAARLIESARKSRRRRDAAQATAVAGSAAAA
jgi:hypothetical protein